MTIQYVFLEAAPLRLTLTLALLLLLSSFQAQGVPVVPIDMSRSKLV
jgi:hypothetical protein